MHDMHVQQQHDREARALVLGRQIRKAFPACVAFVLSYVVYRVGGTVDRQRIAPVLDFLGLFMSPFLLANLVGDPLRRGIEFLYRQLLQMVAIDAVEDATSDPVLEAARTLVIYRAHKPVLLAPERRNFESMLATIERCAANPNFGRQIDATCAAIQTAIALPRAKRPLDASTVQHRLGGVIDKFSTRLQYTLRLMAHGIVSDSNRADVAAKPRVLYFLGSPGTAKTTTARELAAALGLPLVAIDVQSEFLGQMYIQWTVGGGNNLIADASKTVPFTQALRQAECTNAVLFMDEADKALNSTDPRKCSMLLKLFDGDSTVFLPDLQHPYNVAAHTFILAGNEPIKNKAMQNRMVTIPFDGFNIPARKAIARPYAAARLARAACEQPPNWDAVVSAVIFYETNVGIRSMLAVLDLLVEHTVAVHAGWVDEPFDVQRAYERSAMTEPPAGSTQLDAFMCVANAFQ